MKTRFDITLCPLLKWKNKTEITKCCDTETMNFWNHAGGSENS